VNCLLECREVLAPFSEYCTKQTNRLCTKMQSFLLQKLVYGTKHWNVNGQYTVAGDSSFETRSTICSAGKFSFGRIVYTFIRTSDEKDAVLCKVYWRTGSRVSAHTGGCGPQSC
jgi:hypothetical protein